MGDTELLWELAEAVDSDPAAPVLEQNFDPTNPVEIEIVMHEADFMVENYMEKWKSFRDRFSDPAVFDTYVFEYQMKVRRGLKEVIAVAQQFIADTLENDQEEPEEGEDA